MSSRKKVKGKNKQEERKEGNLFLRNSPPPFSSSPLVGYRGASPSFALRELLSIDSRTSESYLEMESNSLDELTLDFMVLLLDYWQKRKLRMPLYNSVEELSDSLKATISPVILPSVVKGDEVTEGQSPYLEIVLGGQSSPFKPVSEEEEDLELFVDREIETPSSTLVQIKMDNISKLHDIRLMVSKSGSIELLSILNDFFSRFNLHMIGEWPDHIPTSRRSGGKLTLFRENHSRDRQHNILDFVEVLHTIREDSHLSSFQEEFIKCMNRINFQFDKERYGLTGLPDINPIVGENPYEALDKIILNCMASLLYYWQNDNCRLVNKLYDSKEDIKSTIGRMGSTRLVSELVDEKESDEIPLCKVTLNDIVKLYNIYEKVVFSGGKHLHRILADFFKVLDQTIAQDLSVRFSRDRIRQGGSFLVPANSREDRRVQILDFTDVLESIRADNNLPSYVAGFVHVIDGISVQYIEERNLRQERDSKVCEYRPRK